MGIYRLNERSCFHCKNYLLCGCRQDIDGAIKKIKINIDGNALQGQMTDIFDAVGGCCLNYE